MQDLHLAIEIFIETVFEFFHKAAHCVFSPLDTLRKVIKWFSSNSTDHGKIPNDGVAVSVATNTLSDNDPTPGERKTSFYHSLNTDARTCKDVITELG